MTRQDDKPGSAGATTLPGALRALRTAAAAALVITASALAAPAAFAQSPAGLWKSIDDETGKPKALIRIREAAGAFTGRIEKLLNPSEPDPKCTKCTDDRKDQKIEGMTILTGLKANGDATEWDDGQILDPNNGKLYKAKMKLVEGGKKLEVRGFIGVSLFGRTQTWLREE